MHVGGKSGICVWKNAGVYANYANDRIWQQVSLCQALQSNLSRVALK